MDDIRVPPLRTAHFEGSTVHETALVVGIIAIAITIETTTMMIGGGNDAVPGHDFGHAHLLDGIGPGPGVRILRLIQSRKKTQRTPTDPKRTRSRRPPPTRCSKSATPRMLSE